MLSSWVEHSRSPGSYGSVAGVRTVSRALSAPLLSDLRARRAEASRGWHLAVQNLLSCLEWAEEVEDDRSVRLYAARLSLAYRAMRMDCKSEYYRLLAD